MSTQCATMTASGFIRRSLRRSLPALLLAPAALSPPAALAASPQICGTRTEILAELTKRYSEAPVAVGLANSGGLVEVLTNGNGSTWSILVSQPDGTSCLVAAGKEWQELKRAAGSRDVGA